MRGHGCWDDYRAEGEEKNERGAMSKKQSLNPEEIDALMKEG